MKKKDLKKLLTIFFILISFNSFGKKKKEEIKLFPVKINGKFGYINNKGKIVIPPKFTYASSFSEGLAVVDYDKFIDTSGKVVMDFFDGTTGSPVVFPFSEGMARMVGGCIVAIWGYIDKKGNRVISLPSDVMCYDFSESLARVERMRSNKWGYINREGKFVIEPKFDDAGDFSEGLARVSLGGIMAWPQGETGRIMGNWGYINKKGEWVIPPQFDYALDFSEGLAAVGFGGILDKHKIFINSRKGYINKKGKFVIPPQYEDARNFSEGLAGVKIDGKWGYINKKGKLVIKPQFVEVSEFSEGLARVRCDDWVYGKWGYINKKGKLVIKPQFDGAGDFCSGLAKVRVGSKEGYIDKKGKFIWEPTE